MMETDPLVTAAWLEDQLLTEDLRIIDTRWYLADGEQGSREYDRGHIPGAIFMDLESDLSAREGPGRHPLPDRVVFARTLARAGIGNGHHVVVYDDGPGAIAARLWWMLRWAGHARVSVLNGGLRAWKAAGRATVASVAVQAEAEFVLGEPLTRTIDREALRSQLGEVQVLDARAAERYRGESESVDPVAGHIPTALSVPTSGNVRSDGTFESVEALEARFVGLGVDPTLPIVNSCGSGVTACHNILALHIAGFPEPALYPGSWSDWSASGYPGATGPEPGTV